MELHNRTVSTEREMYYSRQINKHGLEVKIITVRDLFNTDTFNVNFSQFFVSIRIIKALI
jgi:cell fate regulator YaaT (PSP1 superfamily)